jgi:molybdopterin converting factor small subunit
MKVQIKFLAIYRKFLPPGTPPAFEREVAPGTSVDDLVASLPAPKGDATVVLVNGREPQPGQVLREGDVVALFPAIAGG